MIIIDFWQISVVSFQFSSSPFAFVKNFESEISAISRERFSAAGAKIPVVAIFPTIRTMQVGAGGFMAEILQGQKHKLWIECVPIILT
tara:strand:- start:139 stop:402 length:264 start_codon:yes stop_codon:yes gene_type:complete